MKRRIPHALLLSLLIPLAIHARWLTAPKGWPQHGAPAAKTAAGAAIANLSEIVGMWRFIKVVDDSGGSVHDTLETWVGSDNKIETRSSLVSSIADFPGGGISQKTDVKGSLKVVGANIVNTTTSCQFESSLLGSSDCMTDDPYDTTALSDYSVTTIDGKKALIIKAKNPDDGDDTAYYVGASAAFLVQLPPVSVRRFDAAGRAARGGLRIFAGSVAAPGVMGLRDLRGRELPATLPASGVFLIRP